MYMYVCVEGRWKGGGGVVVVEKVERETCVCMCVDVWMCGCVHACTVESAFCK